MISMKAILGPSLFICLSCFGCITDEAIKIDNTDPVVSVISPELDRTYVAEWGAAWPEGEPALLEALGTDDVKVKSMQVIVKNSNGGVVLDKVIENLSDNKLEFILKESFTAETEGVFTVVFSVIDSSGNEANSVVRTITYV